MKEINTDEKIEIINNTTKKDKDMSKYSLIISIIFLIFGAVLATNPGDVVKFISYIVGSILLIIGIIRVIIFINNKKKYEKINVQDIVTGIVFIILGLIAIIWGATVETVIRIIIGAWILYCGITKLIFGFSLNKRGIKNDVIIIVSIIMIVIGLSSIMIKYIEFTLLGILIILYSISDIVGYIFYSKK